MRISSKSFDCDEVPFANEDELQGFVIKNVPEWFGAEVVAHTLEGGRQLHKIDILAVDASDCVYVIECKWDAVDSGTIEQLLGYRDAVVRNWRALEKLIAERLGRQVRVSRDGLVLVAIGHRCSGDLSLRGTSIQTFVYKYHAKTFDRFVESQSPGVVRFGEPEDADYRSDVHPEVLKTGLAKRCIKDLPPEVRRQFWSINAKLRRLDGVRAKYNKKPPFAWYRRGRKVFAKASIGPNSILWFCWVPPNPKTFRAIKMGVGSDLKTIFETLRRAYRSV